MREPFVRCLERIEGFETLTEAGIVCLAIIVPTRRLITRPFCWMSDGRFLAQHGSNYGSFGGQHLPYLEAQMQELGLRGLVGPYSLQRKILPELFVLVNQMRALPEYSHTAIEQVLA
ncbi:MAG: hypothetical protein COU32_02990 [Candidatus Magasanikbacteria bacterium CG10_big_fil_rev_8_21_14_0_10_42_10]|uniref:Uncharacterized protein n=2 Tax=Candidatus Magasanikiibacteriota TaxID=1752731 RepID=A0A2H0TVW2_9BACT|nr:MAG: hypothetical protein COU32_02990 [Candidatus Magasanikbacteria bacterium CG10_big_fil_rev_8_21_14_0_10_42_10]PIZ92516.1 MAG: hypothetical protein COX82_04625 [Candidatus Magasanikbacteria bacterium CG_4_10_14_0_2_um_filter_41_10]